jgi:hypothetical protein
MHRTSSRQIAKVVYGALPRLMAIGQRVTAWAGGMGVVTAVRHQVRPGEVLDVDHALSRVWHVFTRSEPRVLP